MTYANGSTFHPVLDEDRLPEDETTEYPNRIPTFHGYSASGAADAEFVYVGRGQQPDFERLVSDNCVYLLRSRYKLTLFRSSSVSNSKARLLSPDMVGLSEV